MRSPKVDLQLGGEPHLLIDSERMEEKATFSPDRKFIFFVGTYSGNADIYRLPFRPDRISSMKAAENLTHSRAAELRPSISPDGQVMAFSSDRDLPVSMPTIPITRIRSGDIWTLNLSDRTLHRLTHVSGTGWNGFPKWSADGKQIIYHRDGAPTRQPSKIMVMDANGSNQRAVTAGNPVGSKVPRGSVLKPQ